MKKSIFFVFCILIFANCTFAQKIPIRKLPLLNKEGGALICNKSLSQYPETFNITNIREVVDMGKLSSQLFEQISEKALAGQYRLFAERLKKMHPRLIILSYRVHEGTRLPSEYFDRLEKELLAAQEDAENMFKQKYQDPFVNRDFRENAFFLSLLEESVAYRMSHFLSSISNTERVQLLKVLMRGTMLSPLNMLEFYTAVLARESHEGLGILGKKIQQIERYGDLKKSVRRCVNQAAWKGTESRIESVSQLRELFINELISYSSSFAQDRQSLEDWNLLINFLKKKQMNNP